MADNVFHPSHYTDGGIETIEFIRAKFTAEEFVGYCKGNGLKYISRSGKKGDSAEDLDKAIVYLTWGAERIRQADLDAEKAKREKEIEEYLEKGIEEYLEVIRFQQETIAMLRQQLEDKEIKHCIERKREAKLP